MSLIVCIPSYLHLVYSLCFIASVLLYCLFSLFLYILTGVGTCTRDHEDVYNGWVYTKCMWHAHTAYTHTAYTLVCVWGGRHMTYQYLAKSYAYIALYLWQRQFVPTTFLNPDEATSTGSEQQAVYSTDCWQQLEGSLLWASFGMCSVYTWSA